MDREYYAEYYFVERNHWWFKVREQIIVAELKRQIKPSGNLKILNIGCATGRSSEVLKQFGFVESLEYDKECCEFLRNKTGIPVTNGSVTDLAYKNDSFDMVCAFDVIEHVENDILAISEMERVCKLDGILLITVPAFMSLWSEHDVINHHHRRYSSKTLKKLIKSSSLQTIRITYFNSLLFLPIFLFRAINRLLFKIKNQHKPKSDFQTKGQNKFLNKMLYEIFALEIRLLKHFNFPIGVSLMMILKK